MTQRIVLSIPGEPTGWSRATPVPGQRPDGTLFVRMLTTEQARKAMRVIRETFRARYPRHRPWTGPVMLNFTVVFETPRSFNRALRDAAARGDLYATKKPDKDNIEKLICDALNGLAFVDDAQVQGGGIKRYGSPARIDISLRHMTSPDVPATPGQRRAERAQQQPLPLPAPRAARPNPTKSVSIPNRDTAPDLSAWSEKQRRLIQAALDREASTRPAGRGLFPKGGKR